MLGIAPIVYPSIRRGGPGRAGLMVIDQSRAMSATLPAKRTGDAFKELVMGPHCPDRELTDDPVTRPNPRPIDGSGTSRVPRVDRATREYAPSRGDAIGADGFAERTRHELLATGETVRKRRDDTRDELTPQKEHIARLALSGRSNPEIGAEPFISPAPSSGI
jgi:hypothetical protein